MKATYTLRLPDELQRKIKEEAERSKMSINQYILYTLTKDISYKEAERALKDRIKKAPSPEEALRILEAVVPDVPPLPEDNLHPAK
jgi:predicted transcriptional regulator